ncbi:MAG: glycosyltransferase family 2 protein [Thermoproteus sp.]|nr:glycosyltransferase family 2 protein [Thermoproteus sp.]
MSYNISTNIINCINSSNIVSGCQAPTAPQIAPFELTFIYIIYSILLFLNIFLGLLFIKYFRTAFNAQIRRNEDGGDPRPISFVVPVKGEPLDVIASMLYRFNDVDYPRDLFEVVILSDDDEGYFKKIEAVVEGLARELGLDARAVRRSGGGRYRGSAYNWIVDVAKYDVLVFLDVDSRIPRDIARRAAGVGDDALLFLGWDGYISLFTRLGRMLRFAYRYLLLYGAYLGRALSGDLILALGSGIAATRRFLRRIGGFCDCVADDYDISLKALMRGGRIIYDGGEPIYVEIPSTYFAFRRQYARWVFNSAYIFRKYVVPLMRSRLPLRHKLSLALTVLQHPLLVSTTVLLPVVGLAAAYTGYIIPPLPVALLEAALLATTLAVLRYVVAFARREGYGVFEALALAVQNGVLMLMIDIVAFAYMVLGLFKDSITWRVTPKGESQRAFRESLLPEALYASAAASALVWALLTSSWTFAASAAVLLAILLYGLWLVRSSTPS